jgi:hypothetical protein
MQFRVMIKKSVLRVLPFSVLFIFLLDRISQVENPVFRISGISALVFGFSTILITIEYFMYRQLNRNLSESGENPFNQINGEIEAIELEELIPVEEENDFGELIEVEDQAQQPVEFINPVIDEEPETIDFLSASNFPENIEELEVFEEPIEELEALDE